MRRFFLLGIAALLVLLTIMVADAALLSVSTEADGAADLVVPGQEYITHEINVTDNPTDATNTVVNWFNTLVPTKNNIN